MILDGRNYLPAGRLLDDSYRLVRVVGAGGFGVTYEAEDIHLGTTVAIKEYFPGDFATRTSELEVRPASEAQLKTFEWGRSSFSREARTLARFRHSSIVRVFRVFEANSTVYMVMEFENGPSLESWLKGLGRPPSQDELDHLLHPILDALELMHAEDFLHRDIAPDNIIIRKDMAPVLLDFGAARKTVATKTHAMTGMFKPGYSPQEQYSADGKHQGPWSDFYALGATLYRAVTGIPPEDAPTRGIHDAMPPAVQAAKATYRTAFLEGIDACLKVHPSERPQTAFQAREVLFKVDSPRPGPRADEPAISADAIREAALHVETGKLENGRFRYFVGMTAVALALLAGTAYYLLKLPPPSDQTAATERKAAEDVAVAEALRRARQSIETNDLLTARQLLSLAPKHASVLFALGETYDPNMLASWQTRGVAADVTLARDYYNQALSKGDRRAHERLEALR